MKLRMKETPATLNVMIGVAGHIDHGKTELVKMLTGCDTDRLKEEKERGMSIELGYAPCYLESGRVGIVDVPGHERFVRKMVAGATGIDVALLVIAADDGIMPQTREHFDIIELLGVQHLLIAVNKIDLVSPEEVEFVCVEARDFLQSTVYADSSITPVSALTGEGLEHLRQRIRESVESVERRKRGGVFRLPVDRVFSSPGHGVVVTGIAVSGRVQANDLVDVLPLGKTARVRGLQVFLGDAAEGGAGQCLALNLANIHHEELERGFVLAAAGRFSSYSSFTVRLRASRFLERAIPNAAKVHFHTGTSETPGKVRFLEGSELKVGEETFAQIVLERSVAAFLRDRFILRLETPPCTLAGGTILECDSRTYKRQSEPVLRRLERRWVALPSDAALFAALMEETPFEPTTVEELEKILGLEPEEARAAVEENIHNGNVLRIDGNRLLSANGFRVACDAVLGALRELHRRHPDRYTFGASEIRREMKAGETILDAVLAQGVAEKRILFQAGAYRCTDAADVDPVMAAIATRIESILREEKFQTSSPEQLAEKLRTPLRVVESALQILIEKERIRRLADTVYLHDEHVQWARRELIAVLRRDGFFETHQFKNVIGSSRKYAIPLLDYFDTTGLTRRVGGLRYLCETKTVSANAASEPSPRTNREDPRT